MLQTTYTNLLSQYNIASDTIDEYWNEIHTHYTQSNRHYHNLGHLEDLLIQLNSLKDKIDDWNTLLFTLYYHDIIYKSTKKNNEEKSADFAVSRMTKIGIDEDVISRCFDQIIATKYHKVDISMDTNYFTDADLSILGRSPENYLAYCQNIRKEYSIYPDILYKNGRKKVIKHFLAMESIYKTKEFFDKYELQARENLIKEQSRLK